MDIERAVQELLDRQRIQDTLYRYASTIDDKDYAGLREVLVDDVVGTYGDFPTRSTAPMRSSPGSTG